MKDKTICSNKYAFYEYSVLETFEAGIVLEGSEVKSLRAGNVNLKDSFCLVQSGEAFIKNMHVAVYDKAGAFNSKDSKRDRKLLLHKSELRKIKAKVSEQGLTLVPIKLYFKQSLVKVELALCRGKHSYDKKRDLMEKDLNREKLREIKNYDR